MGIIMSSDHLQVGKRLFDVFDSGAHGRVSAADVQRVLEKLGKSPGLPQIEKVMKKMDIDGDGVLDFYEFLTALEPHVRAFAQQDRNNDGYLSEVQLQHALRKHPDRQRLKPFDSFPRSTSKGISFTNFLLHIYFDINFDDMHSTTPKANSFFKNKKKKPAEPESKEDIEKAAFGYFERISPEKPPDFLKEQKEREAYYKSLKSGGTTDSRLANSQIPKVPQGQLPPQAAPSSVFKSTTQRFNQPIGSETMGPGRYDVIEVRPTTPNNNAQFSLTPKKSYFDVRPTTPEIVGPGAYDNLESSFAPRHQGPSPAFLARETERRPAGPTETEHMDHLGPGMYEIDRPESRASQASGRRSPWAASTKARFKYVVDRDAVGPGRYNPPASPDHLFRRPESRSGSSSFASRQPRFPSPKKPSIDFREEMYDSKRLTPVHHRRSPSPSFLLGGGPRFSGTNSFRLGDKIYHIPRYEHNKR